ncbi:MAG: hypothetical protein ACK56F_28240, partial [bacterium]
YKEMISQKKRCPRRTYVDPKAIVHMLEQKDIEKSPSTYTSTIEYPGKHDRRLYCSDLNDYLKC